MPGGIQHVDGVVLVGLEVVLGQPEREGKEPREAPGQAPRLVEPGLHRLPESRHVLGPDVLGVGQGIERQVREVAAGCADVEGLEEVGCRGHPRAVAQPLRQRARVAAVDGRRGRAPALLGGQGLREEAVDGALQAVQHAVGDAVADDLHEAQVTSGGVDFARQGRGEGGTGREGGEIDGRNHEASWWRSHGPALA